MIQSVSDSYDDSYLSSVSRTESTAQAAKTKTDTDAVSGSSADSIEISDQARAAAEQYVVVSASDAQASSQTSGGTAQSSDSAAKSSDSAALEKAQAQALESESKAVNSSDTGDSTAYNLSVLTESQLDKLVSDGKITKAQEVGELSRRAAEKVRQQSPPEYSGAAAGYNAQAQSVSDGSAAVGSALDTVA